MVRMRNLNEQSIYPSTAELFFTMYDNDAIYHKVVTSLSQMLKLLKYAICNFTQFTWSKLFHICL